MLPAVEAAGMRVPLLSNVKWAIISLSLFAAAPISQVSAKVRPPTVREPLPLPGRPIAVNWPK